jgi:hypothetical protein
MFCWFLWIFILQMENGQIRVDFPEPFVPDFAWNGFSFQAAKYNSEFWANFPGPVYEKEMAKMRWVEFAQYQAVGLFVRFLRHEKNPIITRMRKVK